jgi:hypothetical protein
MGFAPGYGERAETEPKKSGADAGSYTFVGADMTAWVEINFEGLGWVAFFPTPDRQDSPTEALGHSEPKPRPQAVQPPPPEAKPPAAPDEDLAPVPVGSAKPVPAPTPRSSPLPLAAAALILAFALAAVSVYLAKAHRRHRRCRAGPPAQRIAAGWEQVLDRLAELRLGGERSASDTRLEIAAAGPPPARRLLRALAAESDVASFGALAPADDQARRYWVDVARAEHALGELAGSWRRLRAALTPRPRRGLRRLER